LFFVDFHLNVNFFIIVLTILKIIIPAFWNHNTGLNSTDSTPTLNLMGNAQNMGLRIRNLRNWLRRIITHFFFYIFLRKANGCQPPDYDEDLKFVFQRHLCKLLGFFRFPLKKDNIPMASPTHFHRVKPINPVAKMGGSIFF